MIKTGPDRAEVLLQLFVIHGSFASLGQGYWQGQLSRALLILGLGIQQDHKLFISTSPIDHIIILQSHLYLQKHCFVDCLKKKYPVTWSHLSQGPSSTLSTTRHNNHLPSITTHLFIQMHIQIAIIQMLPAMDRIGSTEGTPVVQMQRAAQKIRPETEQATRVRFQESLALKQEQSLAMVQIMLHVSVSPQFV